MRTEFAGERRAEGLTRVDWKSRGGTGRGWRTATAPVALGLTLALLVAGTSSCHRGGSAGVFVDPAFVPLIPPDSQMLAGVRLEKLRATELYRKYRAELPLTMLEEFKQRTGLDPEKDVWEVLIAGSRTDVLVLVRGHFEIGEMQPKLEGLGTRRFSYKGRELAGDERYAVTFLNPGVAAAGRAASLRALIDRQDQPGRMPPALAAKVASVPKDAQVWAVATGGIPQFGFLAQRDDIQSILENFTRFVAGAMVSVEVSDGLNLQGQVDCSSEEGVKRVKDTMRGVIGLARLTTKTEESDLLRLYDAIEVTADGNAVKVAAKVSPDLVPKLFALVRGRPGMGSVPGVPAE